MSIVKLVADKCQLDTYYYYNGSDRISETGIRAVNDILAKYDKTLPSNFSRYLRFRNQRFATRVRQYMYTDHQIRLEDAEVAAIGQAAQNFGENFSLVYEFTRNFDWMAGDFADGGSCFWGGNAGAKSLILDNQGFAMKVYLPDWFNIENDVPVPNRIPAHKKYDTGVGRAWVLPYRDSHLVVFNCYCRQINMRSIEHRQLGIVLAAHFDLDYRSVGAYNYKNTSGLLFINSGVGTAVGENFDEIPRRDGGTGLYVDFELDVTPYLDMEEDYEDDEDYEFYCERCGDGIYDGDEIYVEDLDAYYCLDCVERLHILHCSSCNAYHQNDNQTIYQLIGDNSAPIDNICKACADQDLKTGNLIQCPSCERIYDAGEDVAVTILHNNEETWVCLDCFHNDSKYNQYEHCYDCGVATDSDCHCKKEKLNG